MTALVSACGLQAGYDGRVVLTGADLAVHPGEELALTGRSGSGKTTLLLLLAGLLPTPPTLTWPGLPVDPQERRARIGLVFQAPSLVPELTAAENVALPLRLRGQPRGTAYDAAQAALAEVGLAEVGGALPAELSGGQQQRVAVARVLAGDPLLVLADEPTGALDDTAAADVLRALRRRVRSSGGALVLATHDERLAAQLPDRVELHDGRLRRPPTRTELAV